MTTWIKDDNGNKNSVEYWGSKEAAQKALDSLEDCENCINCSDCSDCSGCSRCSDCSGCSGCSRCSGCSGCSRCSRCSRCSGCSDCSLCSGCSDCSRCSRCSGCSDCSLCSGCSGCSDCSGCSGCSDCSGCSRCSHIAWIVNKKDLQAEPTEFKGAPPIPRIDDIHKKLYEAVSGKETSLDMSSWHKCETTHCRAGWIVHLAGDAGYALERFHDTPLAAQLIYRESGYLINPANFYDANDIAMADIKRLAQVNSPTD